jgi:GNAT superfamily N-acetyltransferase
MKRRTAIRIRAWQTADAPILQQVFDGLSETSRYLRYHAPVPRLSPGTIRALVAVDGTTHVALVAEVQACRRWVPAGIGRLVRTDPAGTAELAVEVVDACHRRGVGTALVRALRERAVALGYDTLVAEVLAENGAMLGLLRREFPARWVRGNGPAVTVVCPLTPDAIVVTDEDLLAGVA